VSSVTGAIGLRIRGRSLPLFFESGISKTKQTTKKTIEMKILSIFDVAVEPDEIESIVADELIVIHPRSVEPEDWYDSIYKHEAVMNVVITPNVGKWPEGDYIIDPDLGIGMQEWMSEHINKFIERHNDTINYIDVSELENTHYFKFKVTNLTENQLNGIFDDYVQFLRDICPCDVVPVFTKNRYGILIGGEPVFSNRQELIQTAVEYYKACRGIL